MDFPGLKAFEENLDSKFVMRLDGGATEELRLISATDLSRSARQIQFSLIFLSAEGRLVEQKIYRLDHPALGPLDIFLVPIRKDESGIHYEAIYNRFLE